MMFKDSLRTGTPPSDLIRANVAPIFKKDSRQSAANYRSVSLTSVVCKLIETTIRDCVTEHLRSHCHSQN